jgi:hypothetical protein
MDLGWAQIFQWAWPAGGSGGLGRKRVLVHPYEIPTANGNSAGPDDDFSELRLMM